MSDSDVEPPSPDPDVDDDEDNEHDDEGDAGDLVEFPLTKKLAAKGLSVLAKTGDGLEHAFVRLQMVDKQITDISIISCYVHIRYLDLSENCLKDLTPIHALNFLLTLKADNNLLTTAKLDELPFLRVMSLANNRIESTEGISHPQLHALNLNHNQVSEVSGLAGNNPLLDTIELRANQLTSLKGLTDLPCLRKLCLAENSLTTLEGLDELTTLQWVHVRDNKLVSLDGMTSNLAVLQYLNLRGNVTLVKTEEISKLQNLHMLRALVLKGCGVEEIEDYRIEVLSYARRLERLDKDPFTDDERQEAEEKQAERKAMAADALGATETEE
eukprot:scpid66567/ scgid24282/ Leucine-rich repeat-containing protein 23